MKIRDFTELLRTTKPCYSGMMWYLGFAQNHKTTDTFFDALASVRKAERYKQMVRDRPCFNNFCPHAYLVYIFRRMLDWNNVSPRLYNYVNFYDDLEYRKFLKDTLGYEFDFEIPIPMLCSILKDAFHRKIV